MKIPYKIGKAILAILIIVSPTFSIGQQDPMYTQYIFNLQTVNPAYAGSWQTMGFLALTRYQWVGMEGHPSTQTFSLQTPFLSQNVGVGFNAVADRLGNERRLMINLDYSYNVALNSNTSLRFGLKGGFSSYNNDLNSLLPDPDGISDPALIGVIENKFLPNVGVGLFLSSTNYYLSLSVPKIIQNEYEEKGNSGRASGEKRPYYFAGGIINDLSANVKFKPTFMIKTIVGSPVQYDISANFLLIDKFWIGGMYRSGDAVGVIAQWIINRNFRIGYASDFTLSELKHYHRGIHEVMISYEINYMKRSFVSPRYF